MKRTKAQKAKYRNAALGILRRFGGQLDTSERHMYVIDTTAGPLQLSIWDSMIVTRFVDLQRAKAALPHQFMHDRLNPFSGKWNWDGGLIHEQDMVDLAFFQQALRQLLPEGYTPNPDLPLLPYED